MQRLAFRGGYFPYDFQVFAICRRGEIGFRVQSRGHLQIPADPDMDAAIAPWKARQP
jgi:hypothetical protein